LSHLLGAVLSVAGLVVLVVLAAGRPMDVTAYAIYGASLILLYSASAVYHSLSLSERGIRRLQRMDYVCIFLLIAGTYTPICLVALRGAVGWTLFGIVWGIAVAGIAKVLVWRHAPHWIRVTLYILMGWAAAAAFPALLKALPPAGIAWLVAGGVVYTVGAVIYAADRPHLWPGRFTAHDLWHVFVLGGSICHFVLILKYVAMAG
jgi:hemolysin III